MKGSGKSGNSRVSTGRNERAVAAASPFLLFGGVRLVIGDEEEDGRWNALGSSTGDAGGGESGRFIAPTPDLAAARCCRCCYGR